MTQEPIITHYTIEQCPRPMPEGMFDSIPKLSVKFSNGEEKTLFEFYPDEISFSETEFIGLTETESLRLKFEKYIKFLQS